MARYIPPKRYWRRKRKIKQRWVRFIPPPSMWRPRHIPVAAPWVVVVGEWVVR